VIRRARRVVAQRRARIARRGLDFADRLSERNHRPRTRKLTAPLRGDLVLDMDCRHAGRLEFLDRAPDVDRVAVTGVGVADQRNVDARGDPVRVARDQR